MPDTKPYSNAILERYFKQLGERYCADKPAGHTCSVAEYKVILMGECQRILGP
ncbi:hypothetical protein [Rhizobium leguminosarum]|uniref:hypothetical protein n=1 Tax=Rhizobium leguminosarum TaxID=384 RepID=UPI00144245A5|nr:hypothetical protein [Rhizobium leguminosarum]